MSKDIATLFVFDSSSNPDKAYQTLLYSDGSLSCDCPGWTRRNPPGGRTCKHVRFVEAGLGNVHARKVVEYSNPVIVPRQRQRAMPTATPLPLGESPRRMFDLTEDPAMEATPA